MKVPKMWVVYNSSQLLKSLGCVHRLVLEQETIGFG